ncbi:MAG: DUF4340 domain-containing protein [Clostridia bacterium]|nr:DUF4340 domain-containing protein [Clostridia bacterium]
MKRYLVTVIAFAVLLALIGGVVAVLLITNKQSPGGDAEETPDPGATQYVKLLDFSYDKVTLIESCANDTVLTVERSVEEKEGKSMTVWKCTSDDTIEAYSSTVTSLVSSIISSSSGILISNVEKLNEYGFDENGKSSQYVKFRSDEGAEKTVYIGNYDHLRSYRYVYLDDGSKNVYKLNVTSADRMLFRKQSVIQMKAFTFLSTDVPQRLVVYEKGNKALDLSCVGVDEKATEDQGKVVGLWRVRYPLERKSEDNNVNNLVSDLKDVPLDSIAASDVTEADFAKYGLAPAEIEYHLYMTDTHGDTVTYVMKIGNRNETDECYYCLIDDGRDGKYEVYTVPTANVYRGINVLDYIDKYLYMEDSDLLKKVEIDIAGEQHTMSYTYETVTETDKQGNEVEKEEVTRFFDGREAVDDDEYTVVASTNKYNVPTEEELALNRDGDLSNDLMTVNPYEAFNRVLLALYANLIIKDIELTEPSGDALGERVVSVTYTERDGDVFKVELFKRDNTTAWAFINGKYAGGFARTTGIFGEDYLSADYIASLKCLKVLMAMIP